MKLRIFPPFSFIYGNTASFVKNVPLTLMSNTCLKDSNVMFSAGQCGPIPAAWTSTSIPPRKSFASFMAARTCSSSETLTFIKCAPVSSWIFCPAVSFLPQKTTFAPSAGKALTTPSPIPLVPPVTTILFPSNLSTIVSSFHLA